MVGVTLGSAQARRPRQLVTVMSYNTFQGSELSHVFTTSSLSQLGPAWAQDYQNVIRSNIPARARALAAEIKTNQPAVIGLQEAVLWRIRNPAGAQAVAIPGNATQVSYDFVSSLVRALAARGAHYHAAVVVNNTDAQATAQFPDGRKIDVRLTDRVAILARNGVAISNPQAHNYVAHDTVNVAGVPIALKDGWTSVDAKVRGRHFRFITTHIDGFNTANSDNVRAAEASEIVNGPAHTNLPVIFTCDCNSKRGTRPYRHLTAGRLRDTWARVHPRLAGLTCCHRRRSHDLETDVADPHARQGIIERIDYIFSRSPITILGENIVGLNPADRTPTSPRLWPSDHLGLVGFFALP